MALHLGIFVEPYLTEIFDLIKSIEARFSKHKIVPFNAINIGDRILLKQSGGPVQGECFVKELQFYSNLTPKQVRDLFQTYSAQIRAKEEFIQQKLTSNYGTLIWLERVTRFDPYFLEKKYRNGWILLEKDSPPLTRTSFIQKKLF